MLNKKKKRKKKNYFHLHADGGKLSVYITVVETIHLTVTDIASNVLTHKTRSINKTSWKLLQSKLNLPRLYQTDWMQLSGLSNSKPTVLSIVT